METPPVQTMTNGSLSDIQMYLHLEALRRFNEDARNVKRQVAEQARLWLDAKCEYQREYARLANLTKCIAMRVALDAKRQPDVEKGNQALKDVAYMRSKISSDQRPSAIDTKMVEQCHQQLESSHKSRQKLSQQQRNFAESHEALRALRIAVDTLENGLEIATVQAMDQLVEQLLPRPEPARRD
ncbi:hypothetical protein KR074_004156 [Drosophila pseudoananassae]|nr:hypothetical protein KR074_004156 [Drosophila pseudoananassae]